MKSQIYYVVPQEEEKYKKVFQQGRIWHNKLWFKKASFIEIFHHFQEIVKKQREQHQQKQKAFSSFNRDLKADLEKLREGLQKELEEEQKTFPPWVGFGPWSPEELEKREASSKGKQQELKQEKALLDWLLNNFDLRHFKAFLGKTKKDPQGKLSNKANIWENFEADLKKHDIHITKEGFTRTSLTFNYQIPKNIIIKLNKYLFNYLGVWYEVEDYRQVAWDRVEIDIDYSYYWNDYWYLLNANANGIVYNLPHFKNEVCACPAFTQEEFKVLAKFTAEGYELKFALWWLRAGRKKHSLLGILPIGNSSLIQQGGGDFPYFKLGQWEKIDVNSDIASLFKSKIQQDPEWIQKITEGKTGELFSITSSQWSGIGPGVRGGEPNFAGNASGKKGAAAHYALNEWLDECYKIPDLNHCRINHINAILYWRNKVIWKGSYNDIRGLKIRETSNSAGVYITFEQQGHVLASVQERIFIKIGPMEQVNMLLQTITGAITGAVAGFIKGGPPGAAVGAGIGAVGGMTRAGVKQMWQTEHYDEEFTVDEFEHKFLRAGKNPVSLVLEQNTEFVNRYWANKTIKKSVETNQYFNAANFGALLDKEGYCRFKFHTLNLASLNEVLESKDWLQKNCEEGVQIISSSGDELINWYKTKLPQAEIVAASSDNSGDIDIIEIINKKDPLGTFDPSDKVASFITYLHTGNDDNLYSQISAHFGGHQTGVGGTVNSQWSSSPIIGQRNAFCWGCTCQAFEAPIQKGGTVWFLSAVGGSVQTMQVPDNCIIGCSPNEGLFYILTKTTINRKVPGAPPSGWGDPPPSYAPAGGGLSPDAFEPNGEPPLYDPQLGDPGAPPPDVGIEPEITPPEVEPEQEPFDPEPEPKEPEPKDPEPDPKDPTPEVTPDPKAPEGEVEEDVPEV
ncbi:MAG: hypothetical protein MRERV_3c093 [Mycoplasmataceae bacterium RV_VA103A]|nr:MAG: hypothetical protein MRERV_3c093 [Mycoplasmataceae bacterium RV_VA103A]